MVNYLALYSFKGLTEIGRPFLVLWLCVSLAAAAQADENTLRRVYAQPVSGTTPEDMILDPGVQGGLFLWQTILSDLFQPLVGMSRDGAFVPGAAKSWSYSDDGMVLTVNLDPNATWSDGVSVTAGDFLFALERMRDPEFAQVPPKFLAGGIVGFEGGDVPFGVVAESPTRLRIEMTAPNAITETMLHEIVFSPLPRHVSPSARIPWSTWKGGVTNGAYTLEAIEDQTIRLRRNPLAPERIAASFENVESVLSPWPDAAASFLKGEVDYLFGIPERQLSWFVENDIPTHATSARVYYYALNSTLPQLSDRRVRRALRLAVDRFRLTQQLFPGHARPAYSIIPLGVRGYQPHPSLVLEDVDAAFAEAERLMREAGFGPDNRLQLTISSNFQVQHQNIADFVAAGWSEIYVDVTFDITERDFQRWFRRFTDGDYMVGRRSWNTSQPRMESFMLVCTELNDPRCGHFADPRYKDVLNNAMREQGLEERRRLFQEADRLIVDADVLVPLFHGLVPVAFGNRIDTSGFSDTIRTYHSYDLRLKPN